MSKRLTLLERMLAEGSSEPFHHYAYAMELRSLGRLEEGLAAFSAVEARFASYVPTYLMAAQLAQELSRLDAARDWIQRGLAIARAAGDTHTVGELESLASQLVGSTADPRV